VYVKNWVTTVSKITYVGTSGKNKEFLFVTEAPTVDKASVLFGQWLWEIRRQRPEGVGGLCNLAPYGLSFRDPSTGKQQAIVGRTQGRYKYRSREPKHEKTPMSRLSVTSLEFAFGLPVTSLEVQRQSHKYWHQCFLMLGHAWPILYLLWN
jgi:hypothetical protein